MKTTIDPDRRPSDSFDRALVTELRQVIAQRNARPQRRQRRRAGALVAGIAAVSAGAFGVSTLGSAAYAVEETDSGDIRIAIHQLDDATGLEQALAEHGIDAKVDYEAEAHGAEPRELSGSGSAEGGPESSEGGGTAQSSGEGPAEVVEESITDSGTASTGTVGELPPGSEAETSTCGDLDTLPLSTDLTKDAFVIAIPKDSALRKSTSQLQITTSGDLDDSVAGLEISYTIEGVECGFGSMSAGSGGTGRS